MNLFINDEPVDHREMCDHGIQLSDECNLCWIAAQEEIITHDEEEFSR